MLLTKDDVIKIAKLSRIQLTEEEVGKFQKDLSMVLDYVAALMEINVDGIEEISQVTGLVNVQRRDIAISANNRDAILAQIPAVKDGFVQVKAIL